MSGIQAFFSSLSASGFLHNVFLVPLLLVIGDFATGVASSLKNGTFDFSKFADVMGKDSDLLKFAIGATTLFLANSLHFLSPELNILLGTGGAAALSVTILHSLFSNIIELLPKADQPIAQAIATGIEQEVQSVLSTGTVPPLPIVVAAGGGATVNTASIPASLAVPVEHQATASLPVVQGDQFKMPSGL